MRLARWAPPTLALFTAVLGVVNIVSALTPEQANRLSALRGAIPLTVSHAASAATAVVGLVLVMLAHGLRRRKRRAWRTAVVLLLVSTAFHLVKGLDVEEAGVTFLLALLLVMLHREFYAAGDPTTRWRAPLALIGMLAASVVLGIGLLAAQSENISGSPSVASRLQEVLYGLVGVGGPLHFTSEKTSDLVFGVLLALGIATVLVPTYLLLRPPEPAARLTPRDEERLRALLGQHGRRDSLAYFALRNDKAAVFSATGKSAISYRVVSGVMLASGDPIGDPEAWPGAIREFVRRAHEHAWIPAVIGCSELGGEVWVREAELRALELGDEAVVFVADFTLDGRAMRNVRQTVNRAAKLGYTTEVRRTGDLSALEVAALRAQAASWRGAEVERGFSMALGRVADPADPDCVIVTASREGRLHGVLQFVPWGSDGLSLDVMRRDRAADTGLNELMIVRLLDMAQSMGLCRLSLNFTVFRSTLDRGGRLGAGPILRVWRGLLLFASRWFQIESLYRFNAKFRPVWEPRFVCYPAGRDIPRVAIAALEAEAFITHPVHWRVFRRTPVPS
ncbi:MAG: phosphatidylglycerol lysyltransferase domain-containing protein [Actinomycetes bacterium]